MIWIAIAIDTDILFAIDQDQNDLTPAFFSCGKATAKTMT